MKKLRPCRGDAGVDAASLLRVSLSPFALRFYWRSLFSLYFFPHALLLVNADPGIFFIFFFGFTFAFFFAILEPPRFRAAARVRAGIGGGP